MNNITDYIGRVKNKQPEYRFTGNLFNLFPELLNYEPLSENTRMWLSLTPVQRTWYFVYKGVPFNFYPIFLKITSVRAGIDYQRIRYKLSVIQMSNASKTEHIKL